MMIDARASVNGKWLKGHRERINKKYTFIDENGIHYTDYTNYKLFKKCGEIEKDGLRKAGYVVEDWKYEYPYSRKSVKESNTNWIVRSHK